MKPEIKERVDRIRNGEVPEGYKETKVGIIPDDWEVVEIGKMFEFKNGLNKEKSFFGHGKKIVNFTDVYNNRGIKVKDLKGLVDVNTSELERYKVNKGDVFFTRTSESIQDIGMSSVVLEAEEETVFSGFVLRARAKNDVLSLNFKKYCFSTNKARKEIVIKSSYTTRALTSGTLLNKVLIAIPENEEQEKIAEIISTWDKAIEIKEKLIEEKKEFKRGLMQKLLVGKLRFKEHVGNPNLQEVKRYSILPEEWDTKKASSIFSNISTKNNHSEQLLSATQNNGVIPRDMLDGDVMSPSGDTKSYKLVEEGDFVISLRSFQGGIEYSCYQGIISPAYTVLKNKIPICKDFYRHLFKSRLFIDRLASSVIGIRDGKQISYDDFSFMFLPYPELKEQEKIADMLNNIDNIIEILKSELNQLNEQKIGLMQLLLTGIVRVEVD